MELVPDDSREQLEAEAAHLYDTMAILRHRFTTGKHDDTATAVRKAAAELLSRARHPSRMTVREMLAVEAEEAEAAAEQDGSRK